MNRTSNSMADEFNEWVLWIVVSYLVLVSTFSFIYCSTLEGLGLDRTGRREDEAGSEAYSFSEESCNK